MPRCRDGLGVGAAGAGTRINASGWQTHPPVRLSVCKIVSDLQSMVGYIDNFFECFGCVNELQMRGIWFSRLRHAGVPSPGTIKR